MPAIKTKRRHKKPNGRKRTRTQGRKAKTNKPKGRLTQRDPIVVDEPGLTIRVDGVDGSGGSKMSFTVSGMGNSVNVGTQVGQERDRILYDGPYSPGTYKISVTARELDPSSDDEFTEGSADLGVDLSTLHGQAFVTITQKPGDKDDNDVDDDDPDAPEDPDEEANYSISIVADVTPAVNVLEADISINRITVGCKPSGPAGVLKISLKGLEGASEQIYLDNNSGAEVTVDFGLDRFTNAQAEKTFTHVEAEWQVAGNTVTGAKYLDPPFEFLGVWKITNYFTPVLERFAATGMRPIGTGIKQGRVWRNLHDVNYPVSFLNSVDQGTEGLGLIGGHVVRFRKKGAATGATPWTGNVDGIAYFLADPDSDQETASCPPNNLLGTTDTVAARTRKLRCGAKVMIQGLNGIRIKRDTGGGLLDGQVDVYIGEGGDALSAQAKAWGEKERWVINLLY